MQLYWHASTTGEETKAREEEVAEPELEPGSLFLKPMVLTPPQAPSVHLHS